MKKYIRLFVLMFAVFSVASCEKEVENWSTEAVDYAGKFITKCYNDQGDLLYNYNTQNTVVYVANSAANTNKQLVIQVNYLGIRSKFDITGTPSDFKSPSVTFDKSFNNEVVVKTPTTPPTTANAVKEITSDRIRVALVSASIQKDGYTTQGNNVTDKFSMQFRCFAGKAVYEAVPEKPGSLYFKWKLKSVEEDATATPKVFKLEGFRNTGFHEDDWE